MLWGLAEAATLTSADAEKSPTWRTQASYEEDGFLVLFLPSLVKPPYIIGHYLIVRSRFNP
jgi:hypothetical protein